MKNALSKAAKFTYTVLLRPKPLRQLTHAILRRLIPAYIRIDGRNFYLDPSDPVVSGALMLGVYENEERTQFCFLIRPGMTVLDVGAHIGLFSVLAATRGAKVIAFEPEPRNLALLRKNVEGLAVEVVPKAVSDRVGTARLGLHPDNKGRHSIVDDEQKDAIPVPTTTLSMDADIIKLDVEGAEPLVLKGAKEMIERCRPVIFLEFTPRWWERVGYDPLELLSWLASLGYVVKEIGGGTIQDAVSYAERFKGEEYANLLCMPQKP